MGMEEKDGRFCKKKKKIWKSMPSTSKKNNNTFPGAVQMFAKKTGILP